MTYGVFTRCDRRGDRSPDRSPRRSPRANTVYGHLRADCACTPGSAPDPTLGIEYGKAFIIIPVNKDYHNYVVGVTTHANEMALRQRGWFGGTRDLSHVLVSSATFSVFSFFNGIAHVDLFRQLARPYRICCVFAQGYLLRVTMRLLSTG